MGNADALTFLNWEANFLVGRFLNSANGFNPHDGVAYSLNIADDTGNNYQTWSQIEQATAAAGNSNGIGWANADYAELAAQTLAGLITVTGSAAAKQAYDWLLSSGAPEITPYFSEPQFDIVPHQTVSTGNATLSIAAANATLSEGATGTTTPFTFTVVRGGNTSIATSASWAVTGSGANPAAASDFVGAVFPSGTVSFAAGETSKTITVNVAGDTVAEPDEGFTVTLSKPAASTTIGTATATGSILLSGGPTTYSLFSPGATPGTITENDPNAVNLGVKFQVSTNGTILGIRFYKGPQNTGVHTGDLWTTSGTLLASATFTNETASGWQQVNFSNPVSITAGTTYIASYETTVGEYSEDDNYFTNALTNGPLTAPSSSSSGGNRVYAYGSSNPFPNNTYSAANYWVDVVFSPSATQTPPVLSNVAASAPYSAGGTATTLSSGTTVSDPESTNLVSGTVSITSGFATGDTLAATTTGTNITASYNASTGVLSLSGSDTLAHYEQVLDSVSLLLSSQNPTNSGADPSRTVSWVVNDGTLNSATQTTTVNITGPRRCSAIWRRLPRIAAGWERDDIVVGHDGQRPRKHEPGLGDGVDHQRLPDRRYAGSGDERHQHHRQL